MRIISVLIEISYYYFREIFSLFLKNRLENNILGKKVGW